MAAVTCVIVFGLVLHHYRRGRLKPIVAAELDNCTESMCVSSSSIPGADVPGVEAPDADVPSADVPGAGVTGADVPDADVPGADVPGAGVTGAEVPDADVPDADVPDADVPDAEVPDAEVPASKVPGAEVPASKVPDAEVDEYPTGRVRNGYIEGGVVRVYDATQTLLETTTTDQYGNYTLSKQYKSVFISVEGGMDIGTEIEHTDSILRTFVLDTAIRSIDITPLTTLVVQALVTPPSTTPNARNLKDAQAAVRKTLDLSDLSGNIMEDPLATLDPGLIRASAKASILLRGPESKQSVFLLSEIDMAPADEPVDALITRVAKLSMSTLDALTSVEEIQRSLQTATIRTIFQPPTLTLIGADHLYIKLGETYQEPGVVASQGFRPEALVVTTDEGTAPNTDVVGRYIVQYSSVDAYGTVGQSSRVVHVFDPSVVAWVQEIHDSSLVLSRPVPVNTTLTVQFDGQEPVVVVVGDALTIQFVRPFFRDRYRPLSLVVTVTMTVTTSSPSPSTSSQQQQQQLYRHVTSTHWWYALSAPEVVPTLESSTMSIRTGDDSSTLIMSVEDSSTFTIARVYIDTMLLTGTVLSVIGNGVAQIRVALAPEDERQWSWQRQRQSVAVSLYGSGSSLTPMARGITNVGSDGAIDSHMAGWGYFGDVDLNQTFLDNGILVDGVILRQYTDCQVYKTVSLYRDEQDPLVTNEVWKDLAQRWVLWETQLHVSSGRFPRGEYYTTIVRIRDMYATLEYYRISSLFRDMFTIVPTTKTAAAPDSAFGDLDLILTNSREVQHYTGYTSWTAWPDPGTRIRTVPREFWQEGDLQAEAPSSIAPGTLHRHLSVWLLSVPPKYVSADTVLRVTHLKTTGGRADYVVRYNQGAFRLLAQAQRTAFGFYPGGVQGKATIMLHALPGYRVTDMIEIELVAKFAQRSIRAIHGGVLTPFQMVAESLLIETEEQQRVRKQIEAAAAQALIDEKTRRQEEADKREAERARVEEEQRVTDEALADAVAAQQAADAIAAQQAAEAIAAQQAAEAIAAQQATDAAEALAAADALAAAAAAAAAAATAAAAAAEAARQAQKVWDANHPLPPVVHRLFFGDRLGKSIQLKDIVAQPILVAFSRLALRDTAQMIAVPITALEDHVVKNTWLHLGTDQARQRYSELIVVTGDQARVHHPSLLNCITRSTLSEGGNYVFTPVCDGRYTYTTLSSTRDRPLTIDIHVYKNLIMDVTQEDRARMFWLAGDLCFVSHFSYLRLFLNGPVAGNMGDGMMGRIYQYEDRGYPAVIYDRPQRRTKVDASPYRFTGMRPDLEAYTTQTHMGWGHRSNPDGTLTQIKTPHAPSPDYMAGTMSKLDISYYRIDGCVFGRRTGAGLRFGDNEGAPVPQGIVEMAYKVECKSKFASKMEFDPIYAYMGINLHLEPELTEEVVVDSTVPLMHSIQFSCRPKNEGGFAEALLQMSPRCEVWYGAKSTGITDFQIELRHSVDTASFVTVWFTPDIRKDYKSILYSWMIPRFPYIENNGKDMRTNIYATAQKYFPARSNPNNPDAMSIFARIFIDDVRVDAVGRPYAQDVVPVDLRFECTSRADGTHTTFVLAK
jgi:hypothetical protein